MCLSSAISAEVNIWMENGSEEIWGSSKGRLLPEGKPEAGQGNTAAGGGRSLTKGPVPLRLS